MQVVANESLFFPDRIELKQHHAAVRCRFRRRLAAVVHQVGYLRSKPYFLPFQPSTGCLLLSLEFLPSTKLRWRKGVQYERTLDCRAVSIRHPRHNFRTRSEFMKCTSIWCCTAGELSVLCCVDFFRRARATPAAPTSGASTGAV